MEIGWLWVALGLAWMVNLLLFVWLLRLRMEVWANRRVIAALEEIAHHPGQKGGSKRTSGLTLGILLLFLLQLLFLFREFGR